MIAGRVLVAAAASIVLCAACLQALEQRLLCHVHVAKAVPTSGLGRAVLESGSGGALLVACCSLPFAGVRSPTLTASCQGVLGCRACLWQPLCPTEKPCQVNAAELHVAGSWGSWAAC